MPGKTEIVLKRPSNFKASIHLSLLPVAHSKFRVTTNPPSLNPDFSLISLMFLNIQHPFTNPKVFYTFYINSAKELEN